MNEQLKKMTETPVNKLIISLAIPTIVSMLITNIYNLADTFFVGKIGTSASGAIGVVFAIQTIIQAVGFMFGQGAGAIIGRKLGGQEVEAAGRYASTAFYGSILLGLIVTLIGLVFTNPVLRLLGSTETILPYARQYGIWVFLSAPFMASSCVLNNILRYEGKATLAMVGLTLGGILNMIGDPIFMFLFGMGASGAGLSTALSQVISFGVLYYMFAAEKTQSKIKLKYVSKHIGGWIEICSNGFPSMLRQGLGSVSTMALNHNAAIYGDPAIAAMSIVNRVTMFIVSVMIGMGQGMQPVIGQNFGAKKYKRVREAFKFTAEAGEVLLFIFAAFGFIFAPWLVRVFRDDPAVVAIGIPALRYSCIAIILQPLGVCTNMMFQCVGESKKASFVAMLRTGLYFLPLIYILPMLFGLTGVQISQCIADVLTVVTATPMALHYFKHMPKE